MYDVHWITNKQVNSFALLDHPSKNGFPFWKVSKGIATWILHQRYERLLTVEAYVKFGNLRYLPFVATSDGYYIHPDYTIVDVHPRMKPDHLADHYAHWNTHKPFYMPTTAYQAFVEWIEFQEGSYHDNL